MMVVGAVTIVVAGGEGRRELAILIVVIVKKKKPKKKTMAICFHLQFDKEGHHSVHTWEKKYENREMCVYLSSCYLHFADLEMKYAAVVFKRIRLVAVVIESHYPL